MLIFAQKLRAN